MWNIKAAADIMGGGASAPDDIPVPNDSNSNYITYILILIALITIFLGIVTFLTIKDALKEKQKNQQMKTTKNKSTNKCSFFYARCFRKKPIILNGR